MVTETIKPLHDIKAVISGGASGLGLATAQHIVAAGGQAALLDVDVDRGRAAQHALGEGVRFIETDVTRETAVDAAVGEAVEALGSINLAVNCAGVAPAARVLGKEGVMKTEEFSRVVTINLVGTFCLVRAAADVMQHNAPWGPDGERGLIVNTASIAAFDGQVGQAHYAASKAGIVGMTLPLARELARFGIRVMTIAPGLFRTPLFDDLPQKAVAALEAATPFPPRLGRADEFARLVCHLYQNPMFNGETVRLDGALRMG